MKKGKLRSAKANTKNLTHDTVPATVGLVKEVRNELRADIQAVDHKIEVVDSKIDSVRSDLIAVEHRLESKIELVMVSVHRTQILMEEQRAENKIVLDDIKTVIERQDRFESEYGELR